MVQTCAMKARHQRGFTFITFALKSMYDSGHYVVVVGTTFCRIPVVVTITKRLPFPQLPFLSLFACSLIDTDFLNRNDKIYLIRNEDEKRLEKALCGGPRVPLVC